jgi:hypothetical protein
VFFTGLLKVTCNHVQPSLHLRKTNEPLPGPVITCCQEPWGFRHILCYGRQEELSVYRTTNKAIMDFTLGSLFCFLLFSVVFVAQQAFHAALLVVHAVMIFRIPLRAMAFNAMRCFL